MALKRITKAIGTKEASISDASWGAQASGVGLTIEGIKALPGSLTPAECYQLSVDVRSAITAITTNIAKAKLRLFSRRTGDEIIGGDLYEMLKHPAVGWSTSAFITEVLSNYLLTGEIAISLLPQDTGGVVGCVPLNPLRLYSVDPNPKDWNEIKQWKYNWPNGIVDIINSDAIIFAKNYNPLSHVRGIPPVLAGVNEISAAYQATKYNKNFFMNNAMPNHILVLPPGISKKDREAFRNEYIAMHSGWQGQAHKVFVCEGGTGLEIKTLEQPVKDGQFLELQKLSTSKIAQLYKVPPCEMGMWDQTKYDSVDIEREIFAENTLMPLMDLFSQTMQAQLVDRHYSGTKIIRSNDKPVMHKQMADIFERAVSDRTESDIIILLDPTSLPIVNKINQNKLDYAIKYMETFKQTPDAAAKLIGMDIESNEASRLVWYAKTSDYFDPAVPAASQTAQTAQNTTKPNDQTTETKELSDEQSEKAVELKAFYRELRKLALECSDNGKVFTLKAADALNTNNDPIIQKQIRVEYQNIHSIFNSEKDIEKCKSLIKECFNAKTRKFYRDLVK